MSDITRMTCRRVDDCPIENNPCREECLGIPAPELGGAALRDQAEVMSAIGRANCSQMVTRWKDGIDVDLTCLDRGLSTGRLCGGCLAKVLAAAVTVKHDCDTWREEGLCCRICAAHVGLSPNIGGGSLPNTTNKAGAAACEPGESGLPTPDPFDAKPDGCSCWDPECVLHGQEADGPPPAFDLAPLEALAGQWQEALDMGPSEPSDAGVRLCLADLRAVLAQMKGQS